MTFQEATIDIYRKQAKALVIKLLELDFTPEVRGACGYLNMVARGEYNHNLDGAEGILVWGEGLLGISE